MNYNEFAEKIKAKYPEYGDMDNMDLAKKLVSKYPEYNDVTFDTLEQTEQSEQPTLIQGGVSKNVQYQEEHPIKEAVRGAGREIARSILPEKAENWFVGSKEEENLLKEYGNTGVKNYDQLTNEYQNGQITKQEYIDGINLRNKLDNAIANDEYKQERNKNLGKGIVDIGTGFIPVGAGAKIATKGAQLLKPALGKTVSKAVAQGTVGGALGGAAMGLGEGLIDRDINPATQSLLYGGIGGLTGGALGGIGGNIANKVRANQIAKRKAIPLEERMSEEQLRRINELKAKNKTTNDTQTPAISTEAETVNLTPETNKPSLKELKSNITKQKFGKGKLETTKGRKNNRFYTETIHSLWNDAELGSREFDKIINEIYKNPNIINEQDYISKMEEKISSLIPPEDILPGMQLDAYEKFYKAVYNADEYLKLKNSPKPKTQPTQIEQPINAENEIPETVIPEGTAKLEQSAPEQVYPFENITRRESEVKTSRLGQSDYVSDTLGRKVKVDYDTLPNAELINMAEKEVSKNPNNVFSDLFSRGADENANFSGLDIEKARQLLPKLYAEGRVDDAIKLTEVLSRKGTKAGQAVQAMSLWTKTTPEGAELYAQRVIDKYNDKHPKKPITLSPEQRAKIRELAEKIQKAPEGYEKQKATAIMLKEIADAVPTSVADKFRTLRNISLLFNPKTFTRNVVGNATLGGVENVVTKPLAAGLDKIVSLGTGERSRVTTQGAEYLKGLLEGFKRGHNEVKLGINTRNLGARFDLPNTRVLKAPVLKQLEVATDWSLRVPDSGFYQASFEESLINQIKSAMINKGVKSNTKITPEIIKEYMSSKMVKKATDEALESVFQNNGILASGLSGARKWTRKLPIVEDFGIGDVIIPYAQTPANVAEMGLNYSPVGLLKGAINLGRRNQRQATLDLARGLVGTGIGGLGFGLAKNGLASAEGGKPQEKLNAELLGQKPYTMRLGDNYYSYNQIQPLGSPFAAGVSMGNKSTPVESIDAYIGSILDTSMLRGINQLRSDIANYGPGVAAQNVGLGLPSQLVPTLSGQINAYVDPIQRETYDPNPVQRTLNYTATKIPGLSKNLPARYNLKGEEKKKYESEGLGKAFDVFANPVFRSKPKDDLVVKELMELDKITDKNVLLPLAGKVIKQLDGMKLSGKQYSEYQKVLGEKTYEGLKELINSDLYTNADDEIKADLIVQRKNIIKAFVDEQLFGTENTYKPKTKDPTKRIENKIKNFNKKINKLNTMQILYDDLGISDIDSILEEE